MQVWYHVGSKNEREGRTGFAHLFEHMMFRGSKNVGPEEHMRLVREAGGVVNAYTSFDQTVYWQTVPSNYLERVIWLEADRMASLVVNEENFKKEREVVKEERRLRFENPPYGLLAEVLIDATFQVYPYKHMPIGSMEDLNKATVADVKEFFDTFYVPDNATLVIVGDVDAKQAIALARKHFGPLPRSKKPVPRVTVTEPPQTEPRELTRVVQQRAAAGGRQRVPAAAARPPRHLRAADRVRHPVVRPELAPLPAARLRRAGRRRRRPGRRFSSKGRRSSSRSASRTRGRTSSRWPRACTTSSTG